MAEKLLNGVATRMVKPMTPRLQATRISRRYPAGAGQTQGLAPLDLTLYAGEILVIAGPSGAGKSTLLNLLSGLDRPSTGTVHYAGQIMETLSPRALAQLRNRDFGFVFQQPHLLTDRNLLENIPLPLRYAPRQVRRDGRARAARLLAEVGLADLGQRLPHTLSGGELQRVVFARALIRAPQILFADEPTGNLDGDNARQLLELLAAQSRAGRSIVLVTHDPGAMDYGDRQLYLSKPLQ